ncbi:MAG TPA: sigma-54-dependent Fis family transcriptional regulator [Thermodesulfobacteriota bacterium]|nr:sigma-54-dependent Fis family transcriptional regulator [Thermodesulfobacteriota bacterium]
MHSIKKQSSHEHNKTGEEFPEIIKISYAINSEKDLSNLLYLIAREAADLTNAEKASIFLLDREKQELWSIVTLDGEQIRLDARMGIAGKAAMTGQMINVEDVYQDPRFYKKVDARTGYRTQSLLVVPLKNQEGKVIGTFQVLNKKAGTFTKRDEGIMEALAEQVATAIQAAQLVADLKDYQEQLLKENAQLWKEIEDRFSTESIVGTSPEIQNVVRLIEQISDSTANVLIFGESGTGKELAAKAIHYNSPRAKSPFIAINCAAIPESLIETELFGIEKGVATGVEARIGKFEEANGGTLFLDEIGDLSLAAQAKILRVIQERVLQHVGGRKTIPIDVRILAATNKDLETEIKKGNFRKDLYYRLKEIQIQMPALREIPDDIPILVDHFLTKYCQQLDKEPKRISGRALDLLMSYSWPGNVRELENTIKRLVTLVPRKLIYEEDLPENIQESSRDKGSLKLLSKHTLKERVEEFERKIIVEALERCEQNQMQAAKLLGLSRQGLINKMKRYGLIRS